MFNRRRTLPNTRFRPNGRGPLLGVGTRRLQRRRASTGWRRALVPLMLVAAAASWVLVIGPDLRGAAKKVQPLVVSTAKVASGTRKKAHKSAKKRDLRRPAGPGHAQAPQLAPGQHLPNSLHLRAPVSHALLSAGRDHVARRVHAAWGSVPDLEAVKGADVDLVERGLHLANFPLREAIVRHRFKEPRRYGLRGRPQATPAARKRALTTKTLRAFLDRFAEHLPTHWDGVSGDSFHAGDVVLVQVRSRRNRRRGRRKIRHGRLMFAVVSDRTNDDGVSLLITLNPREGEAREHHPLSTYDIVRHYRLSLSALSDVRQTLGMPPPRARRGRLL